MNADRYDLKKPNSNQRTQVREAELAK
jgi:hypothetical protein